MRAKKKMIITAVIVVIALICAVLAWLLRSDAQMQVGSIFNGDNIESVVYFAGDGSSSVWNDGFNYSDVEEEVAERTTVYIDSMVALTDTMGKAVLKITALDIEDDVKITADTIEIEDREKFIRYLSKIMHDMVDDNKITKYSETVTVEIDMVFTKNQWKIVPTEELVKLFTSNVEALIAASYEE